MLDLPILNILFVYFFSHDSFSNVPVNVDHLKPKIEKIVSSYRASLETSSNHSSTNSSTFNEIRNKMLKKKLLNHFAEQALQFRQFACLLRLNIYPNHNYLVR